MASSANSGPPYPPSQGAYANAQGQYPPAACPYPPVQGQYPPTGPYPFQGQYPPAAGQYPASQGQFQPQPDIAAQGGAVPYPQPPAVPTSEDKVPWNPNQATTYSGVDAATEDVDENSPEQPLLASAPNYNLVIAGYENVHSANDVPVGPPPAYDVATDMVPAMVDPSSIKSLSADEARESLKALVATQSCWGEGAANRMNIKDVKATNAFHYVLETFTEGRSTAPAYVPYRGGFVDGPQNGAAPMPWEIPCKPGLLFKTEIQKIPVPHTETVTTCHLCHGFGYTRCGKCLGRGRVRCGFCHGRGHKRVHRDGNWQSERCHSCHGTGQRRCLTCQATGCVVCTLCVGYRNLKQFIQLTVAFTNRQSEHVVEGTDLPNDLIKGVDGDTIFEQTLLKVSPITNFYDEEVNQKSRELVDKHASLWPTDRILQQRHHLRSVPVHESYFEFSGEGGRFWVYGHNREVFTRDYPHTCCCCRCTCAIL